ncbi:MAG TPA: hypothetical protein VGS80_03350, partial [Ktedonobacterales bacterium]|nr:hypothetical protein [Ktedonobacterales bacterium]
MSHLPPKDTTHAEPPPGGNGDDEHAADHAPSSGALDIAELGTQLPVPPDRLQRQRGARAERAERHEQRAAQLHREATRIQEAEQELAALEHELDALWRTPSGLPSEEDHQRIRDLSDLITERRQRLRHAGEQMADRIARAQRHEVAAAALRAEDGREQEGTGEPEAADTRSALPASSETGITTQLVPAEVRATARAQREAWALDHEREAERLHHEAHLLQDQLEADRGQLRTVHGRYLAQLRAGVVQAEDRDTLQALQNEVTACRERVAADNEALDACHKRARDHAQVARDLRW